MSGFDPKYVPPTAHIILNQQQAQALRILLSLIHYDNVTQEWHDMLPKDLHVNYKSSEYDKDFHLAYVDRDSDD